MDGQRKRAEFEKRVVQTDGVIDDDSPVGRPASSTGGVLPMDVEGPMRSERYRLTYGMTDEDRELRHQWLKDQALAESEPVLVPGYYAARHNPIYRFMNYPMNTLQDKLVPHIGYNSAWMLRNLAKLGFFATGFFFFSSYYLRYSSARWDTGRTGWRVYHSRPYKLPGDEGYSQSDDRHPSDFADLGFKAADPAVTGYDGAHGSGNVNPAWVINPKT